MPDTTVPDALATIIGAKHIEVREGLRATSLAEMERLAKAAEPPRDFQGALCTTVAQGRTGLIAEMKRRSPSGGEIRPGFDPAQLARIYEAAGATCLSVLTDEKWFGGHPDDLKAARAACALPALRKDFLVHPWQVFESRAMGADAVLLIMAALSDEQAVELEEIARSLDMAVLAEVHDEREMERALGLQTRLIGVNNRNLKTLTTDLATSETLVPRIPADRIPVAESGIRTAADVHRMAKAGAFCILVGEHLLRQPDLGAATTALLAA
ncbi:indole-3-glycerol phosphate synthase TrpC [Sabulicella glaciei]|uniref:Indole-3-glycerol phosphate synthase n=1 Tax=Sabulicella glaciei TaxID=2984948 RepID=A0ABT3NYF9_9PROT|nr:indole-3-glycerol phosphate synthase TrpC [Roseococcus sp. MDT2-1-1]MCW8087166.1 indole-3-glycerol phosphate synthase TrpC [Roseococcus sp. MDT2-1-1]